MKNNYKRTAIIFCCLLTIFSGITLSDLSAQEWQTVEVSEDTYIRGGGNSDTNFGTATALLSKESSSQGYTRRILLKFDLSSIEGTISKAILKLHCSEAADVPQYLYLIDDDSWQENSVTWNNRPSYSDMPGTSFQTSLGLIEVDVSGLIYDHIEEGQGPFLSFYIKRQDENVSTTSFFSKESDDPAKMPVLELEIGGNIPPRFPDNLGYSGLTQNSFNVDWDEAQDDTGIQEYLVFLDGVQVGSTTELTYAFSGLDSGTEYTVGVEAVDDGGTSSDRIETTVVTRPNVAMPSFIEAESLVEISSDYPKIYDNTEASGGKVVGNNFSTTSISITDYYPEGSASYLFSIGYRADSDKSRSLIINGEKQSVTLPGTNNKFEEYQLFIDLTKDKFNIIKLQIDFDDDQGGDYDYFRLELVEDVMPHEPVVNNDQKTIGWTNAINYPSLTEYEFSIDKGQTWAPVESNPQPVGNFTIAAGNCLVRVTAEATGDNPGPAMESDKGFAKNLNDVFIVTGDVLWSIGNDDNSSAEFSDYSFGGQSVNVLPEWGASTNWDFFPKGMKGDLNKKISIEFELPNIPEFGVLLSFRLLDASTTIPQLAVFSNGIMCGLIQLPGNGINSDLNWKETYKLYIPKEMLQLGSNTLDLRLEQGIYDREDVGSYYWFDWDFVKLESLSQPAAEPLHGRITRFGTAFHTGNSSEKARQAFTMLKWAGIAYSDNMIRCGTDVYSDESDLVYLKTLYSMNTASSPFLYPASETRNPTIDEGVISSELSERLENYLKTFGPYLTAVEIDNEPSVFNSSLVSNRTLAEFTKQQTSILTPHIKVAAPGWAYWPSGGTPNGWARDASLRREVEDFCDWTNGHSYALSDVKQVNGGALTETLKTYSDYNGDGWPKPMMMTETGTNESHTDQFAVDEYSNTAIFDRQMRSNVGYVDYIMQFNAYGNPGSHAGRYSLFLREANNEENIAHPGGDDASDGNRLMAYRRIALAYGTHGEPLTFVFDKPEVVENKLTYFRAVNTSTIETVTGASSDKVLLNFVNFGHETVTMDVKVVMPESDTYGGERFVSGNNYKDVQSYITVSPFSGDTILVSETLRSGEAIQYILAVHETTPPSTPGELKEKEKDHRSIVISWEPSEDNTTIAGYRLYRDGTSIGTLPEGITSFKDGGLEELTTYKYVLRAFDEFGNQSSFSNMIEVETSSFPQTPVADTLTIKDERTALKYEAEHCIPSGSTSPMVVNDHSASNNQKTVNNWYTTKHDIMGVLAEQQDYYLGIRYKLNGDTQKRIRINQGLTGRIQSSFKVTMPDTRGKWDTIYYDIQLEPNEKNVITFYNEWGSDQAIEYDFFIVDKGSAPEPSPEWVNFNHNSGNIIYAGNTTEADGAFILSSQDEFIEFTIEGRGFRWNANIQSNMGVADVYVNDELVGTIDIPSANTEGLDKPVYAITSISDTDEHHKIRIEVKDGGPINLSSVDVLGLSPKILESKTDIKAVDVEWSPMNVLPGDELSFSASVKNITSLDTPGNITFNVYLVLNDESTLLLNDLRPDPVLAQEEIVFDFSDNWIVPDTLADSSFEIELSVNQSPRLFSEFDLKNNVFRKSMDVGGSTGLKNPASWDSAEVAVYPNPVSDVIFVDMSQLNDRTADILVVNVDGRILIDKQLDIEGKGRIVPLDVAGLQSGIYQLVIKTENNGLVVTPFVVK